VARQSGAGRDGTIEHFHVAVSLMIGTGRSSAKTADRRPAIDPFPATRRLQMLAAMLSFDGMAQTASEVNGNR